jgi:hypothetical protein
VQDAFITHWSGPHVNTMSWVEYFILFRSVTDSTEQWVWCLCTSPESVYVVTCYYMLLYVICLYMSVICLVLGLGYMLFNTHLCNHILLQSGGGTRDTALYTVRGVGSGNRDVDTQSEAQWRANGCTPSIGDSKYRWSWSMTTPHRTWLPLYRDSTVSRGFQIGMFRPIRVDHTNCLQVAIKTHSLILMGSEYSLSSWSRRLYTSVNVPPFIPSQQHIAVSAGFSTNVTTVKRSQKLIWHDEFFYCIPTVSDTSVSCPESKPTHQK